MNIEELAISLQRVEDRSRANTRRIEQLENGSSAVAQISQSLCIVTEKLNVLNETLTKLERKVCALEAAPAKKWEKVTLRVLEAVAAAICGFILAKIGL